MARVVVENRYAKDSCDDEIILCAQTIDDYFSFNIWYNWEDMCGCLIGKEIVILTTFSFYKSRIVELEMTIFVVPNCSFHETILGPILITELQVELKVGRIKLFARKA